MVIFFYPQKEILISITNVFWKGLRDSGLEVRFVGIILEALFYLHAPLHIYFLLFYQRSYILSYLTTQSIAQIHQVNMDAAEIHLVAVSTWFFQGTSNNNIQAWMK